MASAEAGRPGAEDLLGAEAAADSKVGLSRLPDSGDEYLSVLTILGKFGHNVEKIFRVDNPGLKAAFDMCAANFAFQGVQCESAWAFHATRRQATGSIVRSGFDASLAGKAHGTALGAGIYVATTPKYAHMYAKLDAKGKNCMFICKALPGGAHNSKAVGDQMVLKREQQVRPVYLVHYSS